MAIDGAVVAVSIASDGAKTKSRAVAVWIAAREAADQGTVVVHHAQPRRGHGAADDPRDAARVRPGQRLRGDASAADDDPASDAHVQASRRKLSARRVDSEKELADRIRTVGGEAAQPPRRPLDGDDRVVRAGHRA